MSVTAKRFYLDAPNWHTEYSRITFKRIVITFQYTGVSFIVRVINTANTRPINMSFPIFSCRVTLSCPLLLVYLTLYISHGETWPKYLRTEKCLPGSRCSPNASIMHTINRVGLAFWTICPWRTAAIFTDAVDHESRFILSACDVVIDS